MATTPRFAPDPSAVTLAGRRGALEGAIEAVDGLADQLFEAGTTELLELVAVTDRLASVAAAARFMVVAEAHQRGIVAKSDAASFTAWVRDAATSTRQSGGGGIARAVAHLSLPANALVRAAVESGRISISVANTVIAEITKIESRLVEGARDAVLEGMIEMGVAEGAKGVRRVRPELLARHGMSDVLEREADRARRSRALSRPVVDDGLHEYRLVLDPEAAAVFESAIQALSAPTPCEDPETGAVARDLRTSDQRRADALVDLVRAAVGGMDTRAGRGAKATLLVTMSFEDLRSGAFAGRTMGGLDAGVLLDPTTVRRVACEADVVPVVLGGTGEILDLGRSVRLFTAMQVKALWLRDGGCTYPGCTTPATWSDAHHLVHWADGGPSDLTNAALLCQRHHTIVHSRQLYGYLDTGGGGSTGSALSAKGAGPPRVVWDLTPGSYDRALDQLARAG